MNTQVANPAPVRVVDGDDKDLDRERINSSKTLELPAELRGFMLLDALNLDPRPTFIFDLEPANINGNGNESISRLVFCNNALKSRQAALHEVIKAEEQDVAACWRDTSAIGDHFKESDSPVMLFGLHWDFYTINSRWRVVSTSSKIESKTARKSPHVNEHNRSKIGRLSQPLHQLSTDATIEGELGLDSDSLRPSFKDITSGFREEATPAFSTQFGQLLYQFDWGSTHLGPMYNWDQQLLEMFKLMMTDPRPAMLFWGQHNVMLYNEAVVPLMQDRHPSSIGLTVEQIYKEVWDDLHKPLIAQIMQTAEAQTHVKTLLCYTKNGFLEEVYADFTSIPIIGPDGCVVGVYQSIVENTEHILTQRRTNTLSALATGSARSKDLKDVWVQIINCLEENDKDVPQILLYSLDENCGEQITDSQYKLEGSIRWSPKAEPTSDTSHHNKPEYFLSWLFEQSMNSDTPLHLHQTPQLGGNLTPELSSYLPYFIDRFEHGPFGDPCNQIVVFPIRANATDQPMGFAVWGLNSRQPYNESYQAFVCLLRQALATSIASGLRWEQEALRSRIAAEQAEIHHANLSAQLLQQTKEARANELRFTRLVQHGPIGICIYATDGSMAFANEQWWSMTNFPRDSNTTGTSWWMPIISEEDRPYAAEMFTKLVAEQVPVHFEIRLMTPSKHVARAPFTWTLVSAYPEISNEDSLQALVACFTDITEQKKAAEVERTRTEDAVEAKRQQEAFVDITSHEIRNPLSAVLQSAQEISSLCEAQLATIKEGESTMSISTEDLKDTLRAAEIIEQCTMHQKRIVDDILTLSKMDAGMLPVIAAPAQPQMIAEKILEFFFRELSQAATDMKFVIDESYYELNLDWLELDTGRLSQMLINLTTNAIKFTKEQPDRQIELRMGASSGSTYLNTWHLEYLPLSSHKIQTVGSDWPEHECVYLHFSVTDTGTGMTMDEQKTLFNRFSQGSASTYTQYGGSGLGLFICRALVEIHGGQIGFSSMAGIGSTFGFFIRTRRSSARKPSQNASISRALSSKPACKDSVLNILLVEDNLINQRVLSRQLSKLGHIVAIANHGLECLEILQQSHFCTDSGSPLSIILMDIEMPIMDGLTCASKIRSMQSVGQIHGNVPIIAITGNARDEKVQQAKKAGIDEVVLKPFTLPVLMPMINRLMKRNGTSTNSSDKISNVV